MAHLIESMFYLGETPWHGIGTPLKEVPTIEEALELAGMNFEVIKQPSTYRNPVTGQLCDTGGFTTVRMDTGEAIGNVGNRYTVLQNRDAFRPYDVLADFGYKLETAGVIDGGKKIWILAKTPENFKVGDDEIRDYVLLYSSHDGSSGSAMRDVDIRVVCNTPTWALNSKANHEYKLRHTSSIGDKVNELTANIKERKGNVAKAMDQMNRFHDYPLTPQEFEYYLEAVMPVLKNRHNKSIPELGITTRNRTQPVYDTITDLFFNGKGNKGRTLWDGYNAITEYHDHEKKHNDWVKGTQFGDSYNKKRDAFRIASAMVENAPSTLITYN